MDNQKKKAIELLVESNIRNFALGLTSRYQKEVNDEDGVINMKKNNCFIAELGDEFMFYSAFVRSFDSTFGNILEGLGNDIAKLSYEVRGKIDSFILPDQTQRIASILDSYVDHTSKPSINHYKNFDVIYPKNTISYQRSHVTDNYFYNPDKNEHYLIELKASGDLDNKKARAEKSALLEEYYLLKNKLKDDKTAKIMVYYCFPFEKSIESSDVVCNYFDDRELLVGTDYWNMISNDPDGYDVVSSQLSRSLSNLDERCFIYDES